MTRRIYLTARCPLGCEWWAAPEEMARHVYGGRCRRRAWFRRPTGDEVLVDRRYGERLAELGAGHLLRFDATRDRDPARQYLRVGLHGGAALRSPLPGVPVRVWWKVVRPLLDAETAGEHLAAALTADGFASLAPAGLLGQCQPCPECGEAVLDLAQHQRLNSRCRWCAPANRVREHWAAGYRDPWTIPGGTPLTWTALRASRWRTRTVVVEFPRCNAVLLAP